MRIEADRLLKRFGGKSAVEEVSFILDRPMMLGVIGPSGAGKSTLLRLLNRLIKADGGRFLVDGADVLALRGRDKRRWQSDCAMIFQQFNLVPRLDVATNVMLGKLHDRRLLPSLFNIFPEDDVRLAVALLDRLGIAEQAPKRAEALSGGQQQRVAIARALMQDPKIILADEPIASLDPMNAQIVMEALRRIHEEDGRTVICNLHTLDTARSYCDRIVGMRAGRVVFEGTPDELTTAKAREIYGAEALDERATSTSFGSGAEARHPPAAAE